MPKKHERNRFLKEKPGPGALAETAELFPGPVTEFARKITTETVSNSAVLQDDDDLFFPVRATEVWELELVLRYSAATTADFSWALSLPAGSTFDGVSSSLQTGAASGADDRVDFVDETGLNAGGLGTGVESPLWAKGMVVVGDVDGNIQLQWAQRVAEVSNTSLRAFSYILGRKVG